MIIRLLKSYLIPDTGKKMVIGKVFRRKRVEAEQMILQNIAEEFKGPIPLHQMTTEQKMKTEIFKPK